MITIEMKDRVLADLVRRDELEFGCDEEEMSERLGIKKEYLIEILEHFERNGFLSCNKSGTIFMKVEAHDFAKRGGFLAQEDHLKENIKKLGLEIDKLVKDLSPDKLGIAEKISAIGSSILGALKLFY